MGRFDEPSRDGADRLLTPREVADIFQVNIRTIQRWADAGVLTAIRPLPNGVRRYRESQVRELLDTKDN